jgi:hypothetical protein
VAIPKTTEVLVIQTAKQGVTRQQIQEIIAIMPAEIRAIVKLYFDGKIRQWYSRGDGKGVIFLVDARTVDEARALMETLPLAKEDLMDHEYIPVGPLMPLRALMGPGAVLAASSLATAGNCFFEPFAADEVGRNPFGRQVPICFHGVATEPQLLGEVAVGLFLLPFQLKAAASLHLAGVCAAPKRCANGRARADSRQSRLAMECPGIEFPPAESYQKNGREVGGQSGPKPGYGDVARRARLPAAVPGAVVTPFEPVAETGRNGGPCAGFETNPDVARNPGRIPEARIIVLTTFEGDLRQATSVPAESPVRSRRKWRAGRPLPDRWA